MPHRGWVLEFFRANRAIVVLTRAITSMIQATRAMHGIRDIYDVVGCGSRRRRRRRRYARRRRKWRLLGLVLVVGIAAILGHVVVVASSARPEDEEHTGGGAIAAGSGGSSSGSTSSGDGWKGGARSRQLSGEASCDDNQYSDGGWLQVVLLVIAILFTFNGLAIVCDEFFQASLEKITDVLELTPDVAGATFLAAGSSAPELFTSFADVFGPSNSIGVGTIVGSAMFNVLVIVALSAAVASKSGSTLKIDHRVVARDVSFYTGSIFILVLAANDGKIQWWEGLIMVVGYGGYIVFMKFNARLLAMCSAPRGQVLPTVGVPGAESELPGNRGKPDEPLKPVPSAGDGGGENTAHRRSSGYRHDLTVVEGEVSEEQDGGNGGQRRVLQRAGSSVRGRTSSRALRVSSRQDSTSRLPRDTEISGSARVYVSEEAVEPGGGVERAREMEAQMVADQDDWLEWPDGWGERLLFMFGFPFMVGLSLTVPDCSRPQYEKYYIVSFVMSIVWISLITSYMVELATGAACIVGMSAVVMGVLVLAVGTSVPDMIGSMIAAKNGEASMAIANAIGSNVFDILLGLGLPWLIRPLVFGEPTPVDKDGATTSLIILLFTVLVFVGSLMLSRWTMNQTLSYCLLATYVAYVIYTITAEALS